MNKVLVLIVAAHTEEIKALKGFIKNLKQATYNNTIFYSGDVGTTKVLSVTAGQGMINASRTMKRALRITRPSCIIITGFCGATQEELQTADLIVSRFIRLDKYKVEKTFKCHESLLQHAKTFKTDRLFFGTTLTTPEPVLRSNDKKILGHNNRCIAINMESYAIAQVAEEEKIPYIEIRSVLDPVHQNLPDFSNVNFSLKKRWLEKKIKNLSIKARNSLAQYLVPYIENLSIEEISKPSQISSET
ncbi:MAG: hypothetical protein HYS98_06430 [Deltaproteobacteria bacterium]|nr:hypothetical protein [Deltaproteobacteria bacterium]